MKSFFAVMLLVATTIALAACNPTGQTTTSSNTTTPNITTPTATPSPSTYTMSQIASHNSKTDCWLVINGSVYDVTKFIPQHPGGEEILQGCGKDATAFFEGERKHQGPEAQSLLPQFKIGTVAP